MKGKKENVMTPFRCGIVNHLSMLIVVVLLAPFSVFAHGTEGQIGEARGFMVQAFYDDGEAMSYTETDVFHESETQPFQKGRTDRNGRFLFYPDAPGVWRIEVKDEMGHAVILKQDIAADWMAESGKTMSIELTPSSVRPDKLSGLLAGVGIISLVSGFFFWMSARKKTAETL